MRFAVQIGSFRDSENAIEAVESCLRRFGVACRIVRVQLGAKGSWLRVFAGSFEGAGEARAFQRDLERRGFETGPVRPVHG